MAVGAKALSCSTSVGRGSSSEKLRVLLASHGLMAHSRRTDTVLAKCPSMAPMKAVRSFRPSGSHQLDSRDLGGGLRRNASSASYTAMVWASCTKMPGWPLVPELSHTM